MSVRNVSPRSNSYYVSRATKTSRTHKPGQFIKFTSKGKSLAADRLHKSKNHPTKPGQGDKGDYQQKSRFHF